MFNSQAYFKEPMSAAMSDYYRIDVLHCPYLGSATLLNRVPSMFWGIMVLSQRQLSGSKYKIVAPMYSEKILSVAFSYFESLAGISPGYSSGLRPATV